MDPKAVMTTTEMAHPAGDLQASTVLFHVVLSDGKSESGSFGTGGKEGLADRRERVRGNARSVIGNLDNDAWRRPVDVLCGPGNSELAALRHGVDSVGNDLDQDFL